MEDNSRKEMVPLSENDLEEVSGGKVARAAVVETSYFNTNYLSEKDENSREKFDVNYGMDIGG